MSLHDDYARVTPFEIVFRTEGEIEVLAEAVAEEATGRGVDPTDLGGFLTLGSVEAFVRNTAEADPDPDPTLLHRYGPLVYHSVRFAEEGRELYLLTSHTARYLVEGSPEGEPGAPSSAGYLQLPQHLFWTRAAADAPESIDGVFWSVTPGGYVHFLLVTGLRPDRPGVGVVPLPEAPVADAEKWLELEAREGAADFSTELPGAEIDGLYEIQSAGEAFKLMARFFAHLEAVPGAVEMSAPATDRDADSEAGSALDPSGSAVASAAPAAANPVPSRLDFARVTLGAP